MTDGPYTNGKTNIFNAPTKTATFRIGGVDIEFRAMTLADLERAKEPILALEPGDWIIYGKRVLAILAALRPDLDLSKVEDYITAGELRDLATSLNRLFTISGLLDETPGEAQAASSGTGTSTDSPPISPPAASAPETPS